jgi:hypothetical protein
MKKVKLFALLLILVTVVANGSPRAWMPTGTICSSSNDPSLCVGGVDTGCTEWCENVGCVGWSNVSGTCGPQLCVCHGNF